MMKVIAVVAQKGGTGKSLVSANMAVSAAREGHKVLVADADPQQSMVDWKKTRLSPAPSVIAIKPGALHPTRFAAENAGIGIMIIDTRSSALEDSIDAAKAAHLTLVVVRPTAVDLRAIAMTVKALKPLGLPAAFVLNQAPAQHSAQEPAIVNEAIDLLLDYGLPIAPVGLRQRLIYQTSFARGLSAAEAEPQSRAAEEMAELWAYVTARLASPAKPELRPSPAPWFIRAEQHPSYVS
jgi:chromosome partitioning protein